MTDFAKSILYLEGASGISGDMTVAALIGLGASQEKLAAVLSSLQLEGFDYTLSEKKSYAISGYDFDVHLHHEHEHHHEHHEHHEHRHLSDVYAIIDRGQISARANALAKKIFRIVAEAESQAHGCALEEVHFHEVGAIDSIVDIVSAAVLIDDLGIEQCVITGLTEGSGFVHCQHGELPVPVPAVVNIAQKYGITLRASAVDGEMVTPTGIAIAAALRTSDHLPAQYRILRSGIGLGKRDFGHANILRAMLIEDQSASPDQIYILESNIDDATGEMLGFAMEKLLEAGARDVHFMPCYMKKNRPAYLLRVIADGAHVATMERIIFESTTTIGLRKLPVERTCMQREELTLTLPCGTVRAKKCTYDGIVRCYPEYESVKELAFKTGLDFNTLFQEALKAAAATINH
jgi:pyridinium-3,5-bisthiocarboxylic acid mononucleotide nickel chelatase